MKLWEEIKRAWKADEDLDIEISFGIEHIILIISILLLILFNIL